MKKILIVDDHAEVRRLVEITLRGVIVKCCVWTIRQRSSFPQYHRQILFH